MTEIRDWYRQDFRRRESLFPGAGVPWLRARRSQALEQFMEGGFPTPRHEDWKYTDVQAIARRRFTPATGSVAVTPEALAPYALGGPQLVFVDGSYVPALSRLDGLPDGVRVASLAEVLATDPAALEPWLGRHARPERHGFAALNAAFLQDGAFIHLEPGTAVEAPIFLLFVSTGGADTVAYLRNLVVAEAGSRATLIDSYLTLDSGSSLTNAVTEIAVAPGAVLEHYRLERGHGEACHVGATHVHQARDSRYTSHSIALGGRLVRHELDCALDAEGAECVLNGLYLARGRTHVDNHTRIDHLKPRSTSREWYKGVLDERARGVFSGRVVVHPQAQHTDAEQNNRNLLLSRDAEADSRPQLEIYADDVKCSHGSAVGSLDPDQLFYLRTRGLDEPHARRLLVYAFAADVLERMRLKSLRTWLEREIAGQLLPAETLKELLT
jgi:Fe-S cluster assembly protein SufD